MSTPHHHEWNRFKKMYVELRIKSDNFTNTEKLAIFIKKDLSSLKLLGIVLGYPVFKFSELCGFDRDTFYRYSSGKYNPRKETLLKISKKFIEELSEWYIPSENTLKYRFYYWIKNKGKSNFFVPSHPKRGDLIKAYKEFETATRNFRKINQRSVQSVPRSVLVIRHLLGVSQKKFAKLIGISYVSVQAWEYCASMPRKDARLIAKEFNGVLPDIRKSGKLCLRNALKNYDISKDPARIWAKYYSSKDMQDMSLKMLKLAPRSPQELKIRKILTEKKLNFIEQYAVISPVDSGGKVSMLVVDFALPKQSPLVIIEASNFPNIRGVIKLAWKAFRLSKYKPDIIKICFINEIRCSRMKHKKGVRILREAYDHVIENNNFNRLAEIITDKLSIERLGNF